MKLTKEEFEKWEESCEIKRMSHSNIAKAIVNMKHAKRFMADTEYKEFILRYKKEFEIEDVYELTCDGFWNVVMDIVIRLKQGSSINRFITNECVLKTAKKTLQKNETYKPYYVVFLGNLIVCTLIRCILNYIDFGVFIGTPLLFCYTLAESLGWSFIISVFSLFGVISGTLTGRKRLGLIIQIIVSVIGIYIGTVNGFIISQYTNDMFSAIIKK